MREQNGFSAACMYVRRGSHVLAAKLKFQHDCAGIVHRDMQSAVLDLDILAIVPDFTILPIAGKRPFESSPRQPLLSKHTLRRREMVHYRFRRLAWESLNCDI